MERKYQGYAIPETQVTSKIYIVRNKKIMLDRDLAELYEVETRVLNQAVSRNMERFPGEFMFQPTLKEFEILKSQIVISSWGGTRKMPFAFTEYGVAMLSSVLRSKRAIQVNIQIMLVFSKIREMLLDTLSMKLDIEEIKKRLNNQDKNLSWSGAVGLSNKNDTVSIDPDQPVLLASTTKTYVSAAILRLVEQNKISLDSSVDTLISAKSRKALSDDGYDLSKIQIKHLLSHTSGIYDYTNSKTFNEKVEFQPDYRWTRDEQIKLAADEGDPVAEPEEVHKYCDTNYLLLTEIIEKLTGKVFYIAMRELLKYEELKLSSTWFYTLENTPVHLKPFITQYSGYCATDREDPSFDLFGGGGIATTTRDLALFTQYLFTGELFDHSETIDLIYTEVKTKEASQNSYKSYRMGVMEFEIKGMKAYGHRGFWGTYNIYIPQLNTSFAISISNEIDKFDLMRINLQEDLLEELESY